MNILVDGQTLHTFERKRGIGRYFINTLDAMLCSGSGHNFFIFTLDEFDREGLPASFFEKAVFCRLDIENTDGRLNTPESGKEERFQLALNGLIDEKGIDLYWSPNPLMHNVLLPGKNGGCAFVATVFDLIPLRFREQYIDNWPSHMREDYMKRLAGKLYGYDRLMAISWSTKADILDCLKISGDIVDVTHLGVDDSFFEGADENKKRRIMEKYSIAGDYLLYTGGFDFRKNMERLVSGYARFLEKYGDDLKLVIVCAFDAESHKRFNAVIKKERLEKKVILTNHVSDDDLIALYSGARVFIFPSIYEGFGLPVIEAMACGTPVAASSYSSVPEILRNYGVYFDPYSVEAIADGMKNALSESSRGRLKGEGIEAARRFSWRATAKRTLEIFNEVYER
ncbi:MAG: glycosyltransferase family 4 protein [Deltaproteobacteria bacterium]|nr:glycosyltransferase family 4 protein [Deltaproteobacteria bacterium]